MAVIHLDTNYLISLATRQSPLAAKVRLWLEAGDDLAVSAITWSEFLNGPVTSAQRALVEQLIGGRVAAFDATSAQLSSHLFNATGRKRSLRFDCLIAACAMRHDARLATLNVADFQTFVPMGLIMA